jgi:hypothetical protein
LKVALNTIKPTKPTIITKEMIYDGHKEIFLNIGMSPLLKREFDILAFKHRNFGNKFLPDSGCDFFLIFGFGKEHCYLYIFTHSSVQHDFHIIRNTTDVIGGARTAYPSGANEFTSGF